MRSKCMFLCFCTLVIGSHAGSVPLIEKCKWNDSACLLSSSQSAVSEFAKGIEFLGLPAIEHLKIDNTQFSKEELRIQYRDMTVSDSSKCQVTNLERSLVESYILVELECPITVRGAYTSSGQVHGIPINGDGPFILTSDKMKASIKVPQTTVDGADGHKYWKIGKPEYNVDLVGKAHLSLENLSSGDKEKAGAVAALFESRNNLVKTITKPIFDEAVKKVLDIMRKFTEKVPASELEL